MRVGRIFVERGRETRLRRWREQRVAVEEVELGHEHVDPGVGVGPGGREQFDPLRPAGLELERPRQMRSRFVVALGEELHDPEQRLASGIVGLGLAQGRRRAIDVSQAQEPSRLAPGCV